LIFGAGTRVAPLLRAGPFACCWGGLCHPSVRCAAARKRPGGACPPRTGSRCPLSIRRDHQCGPGPQLAMALDAAGDTVEPAGIWSGSVFVPGAPRGSLGRPRWLAAARRALSAPCGRAWIRASMRCWPRWRPARRLSCCKNLSLPILAILALLGRGRIRPWIKSRSCCSRAASTPNPLSVANLRTQPGRRAQYWAMVCAAAGAACRVSQQPMQIFAAATTLERIDPAARAPHLPFDHAEVSGFSPKPWIGPRQTTALCAGAI